MSKKIIWIAVGILIVAFLVVVIQGIIAFKTINAKVADLKNDEPEFENLVSKKIELIKSYEEIIKPYSNIDVMDSIDDILKQYDSAKTVVEKGKANVAWAVYLKKLTPEIDKNEELKNNEDYKNNVAQMSDTNAKMKEVVDEYNKKVIKYNTLTNAFPNREYSKLFGFEYLEEIPCACKVN